MAYPDEYLVFASRGDREPGVSSGGMQPGVINGGMPVKQIRGRLYAFDRSTGKPLWPDPALIDGYSLPSGQPPASPALWFVRQASERSRDARVGASIKASVLGIDRRTGRLLLNKTDLTSQVNFHEIVADPAARTVTFAIPGLLGDADVHRRAGSAGATGPGRRRLGRRRAPRRAGPGVARSLLDAISDGQPAPSPFEGDGPPAPPAEPAEKPAGKAPQDQPR